MLRKGLHVMEFNFLRLWVWYITNQFIFLTLEKEHSLTGRGEEKMFKIFTGQRRYILPQGGVA